jgi:hypothetical protein
MSRVYRLSLLHSKDIPTKPVNALDAPMNPDESELGCPNGFPPHAVKSNYSLPQGGWVESKCAKNGHMLEALHVVSSSINREPFKRYQTALSVEEETSYSQGGGAYLSLRRTSLSSEWNWRVPQQSANTSSP